MEPWGDRAAAGATAQAERPLLLELLQALTEEQLQEFKYLLEGQLPLGRLRPAARPELCSLLLQRFPGGQALRVATDLLRRISRHDLLRQHRLPGAEEEGEDEVIPMESEGAAGSAAAPSGCRERAGRQGASPPAPAARPRRLTEKELIQVAQKLGREWQEVGIACLGLERSRLEQIQEDNPGNVVIQSFKMLQEWQRREKEAATAPRLHACLAPVSLAPEVYDLLQRFQEH